MEAWGIILYICLRQIVGLGVWVTLGLVGVPVIKNSNGIEFVNPLVIYKQTKVNWFGAFFLATLYGMMCPVAAFIYWFYKLCTVGRK